MITSKSNPQLKKVRQLIESAKARNEQGLFVIEGMRLVSEAPEELVECIYVSERMEQDAAQIMAKGRYEIVSDDIFRSLSDTVNPQGVLAVVRKPRFGLDRVLGRSLYVILDDIRDPGNLGTIVRTAEAAGAAVIMSRACVDIFNPKVIRSTMGSIFRVPFAICDKVEVVKTLQSQGVTVCAAVLDGSVPYREAPYTQANAFVIGNEANGVSPEVYTISDVRVRIPMNGKVESLNAAISAAVLLYNMV